MQPADRNPDHLPDEAESAPEPARRPPHAAAASSDELVRTLAALRESERRLRSIFDTAVDGIITIDEHGIIDSLNPVAERMFGYPAEELIGRNVSMLMPMPYRSEHDDYLRRYIETREPRIIGIGREVVGLRKNGSTFPMDLAVSALQEGERWVFTGVVRDITERKIAQALHGQQEKLAAVGQLAAGVAHEVGNPLASISALVQAVGRKLEDEQLQQKLRLVLQHIDRISGILRRMVELARPAITEWRSCSVNELVEDSLAIVRYDKRARHTHIQMQLHDRLPPIQAMPDLLSQVFVNLALNAFDALEANPPECARELRIRTRLVPGPGQEVRLEIQFEDTGPGIPDEFAARVLEPFFTTKEIGKGTGLGLSVCHGIIREHGGEILVEGRSGRGARIIIILPVRGEEGD